MLSKILIIDKRRELSVKYKKSLEDDEVSVQIARNLKDAMSDMRLFEPDLIIISDSIDEKLPTFCQRIRALTYNTRPTIVAISKSADANDRIEVLENGADDFLSEPVKIEEFKTRIKAHLRRDLEINLDTKTLLPNKKIVEKALKRLLNSPNKQATLLISVENLKDYVSVYSDIAGDKLIQTFIAIIKSALNKEDFLGQLDDNTFIVTTSPYSAEKFAAFLTFAFDTVVTKFYSQEDAKRGYTLLNSDKKAGMRVNFVSVLIGGIIDNYHFIDSYAVLIQKLSSIKKMAKVPSGSNYAIDRLKITGENSDFQEIFNNNIFIKEPDDSLALLLRTTLELQGYDIVDKLDINEQPRIVIIDSGDNLEELDFCKEIKSKFVNSKLIVTTSVHDKGKILDSGADLYLPKPYEISDLIRWIEYFKSNNP